VGHHRMVEVAVKIDGQVAIIKTPAMYEDPREQGPRVGGPKWGDRADPTPRREVSGPPPPPDPLNDCFVNAKRWEI